MSALTVAKLLALKRQAGVTREPQPETPEASVEALRRRMQQVSSTPSSRAVRMHDDRAVPGVELSAGLVLNETRVPMDLALPSLLDGAFDRGERIATADVLFFDTETTGLSGGTGTRAFMIGCAQFERNAAGRFDLRVRRWLITALGAEPAMLAEFAAVLSPASVLCSYNGKSYDAPLLRTRFRLARMGNPLQDLRHVDLLYPTRRRYRGAFENCRLCTIERHVLQVVREDDLPGSEAPAAWLSFLRGGSARNLRRVGEHNHQDIVSLSRLLLHLADGDDRPVDRGPYRSVPELR